MQASVLLAQMLSANPYSRSDLLIYILFCFVHGFSLSPAATLSLNIGLSLVRNQWKLRRKQVRYTQQNQGDKMEKEEEKQSRDELTSTEGHKSQSGQENGTNGLKGGVHSMT